MSILVRHRFWICSCLLCLAACGGNGSGSPSPSQASSPAWPPAPVFGTDLEKAQGVGTELGFLALREAGRAHWRIEDGDPPDREALYDGTGGILLYLAELQKVAPDPERALLLAEGGRWLTGRPSSGVSAGLYSGLAGRGMVFLALHEVLGDPSWLEHARAMGALVQAATGECRSDLFEGPPGFGILFLELYAVTGESRWRDAARDQGDAVLAAAIPSGEGIKIPYAQYQGMQLIYPGLSHGNAGAGYFLCRLAKALGIEDEGKPYLDGALAISRWLDGIRQTTEGRVDWYRREPDQMDQLQRTWCHGTPGIGHFYAALWQLSEDPAHLGTARSCGDTVWAHVTEADGFHSFACLCHGQAGNAELFLILYRATQDEAWLNRARSVGNRVWDMRRGSGWPDWLPGNGSQANMPGLMTGMAGVGLYFLQLHAPDRVRMPISE